jgi:ABC-type Co2+ transport system permease subunit
VSADRPPSTTRMVLLGLLAIVLGLALVVYLFTVLLVELHG